MPTKNEKFIPIQKIANTLIKIPDTILVFDIDDTLLPNSIESTETRRKNLLNFLKSNSFSHFQAHSKLNEYSQKYGVALKGLINEYKLTYDEITNILKVDPNDYSFIKNDFEGLILLNNFKCKKICFTNSDINHARIVLEKLGLIDCFEYVLYADFYEKEVLCKPKFESYRFVENVFGIEDLKKIYFFDDKNENVKMAQEMGWSGFLVDQEFTYKDFLKQLKI